MSSSSDEPLVDQDIDKLSTAGGPRCCRRDIAGLWWAAGVLAAVANGQSCVGCARFRDAPPTPSTRQRADMTMLAVIESTDRMGANDERRRDPHHGAAGAKAGPVIACIEDDNERADR